MLKKLRRKFIGIFMSVVAAMLILIFGLIFYFMNSNIQQQIEQMIQATLDSPPQLGSHMGPHDGLRLPYLLVQISPLGTVSVTGRGCDDLMDASSVNLLLEEVHSRGSADGYLKEYAMQYRVVNRPGGASIVLVDTSSQISMLRYLVWNCAVIGLISIGIFYGISILLANWAVRPVERAWQQQKQFVADASHELKTPLTVIMTNAELIQNAEYPEETRQQFAASIHTMSRQMKSLVEGMLELARLDNGEVSRELSRLNLSDTAEQEVLPFEALFFERNILLSVELMPNLWVIGNTAHLRQVVRILLDNALKYARQSTEVTFRLKKQGNQCFMSVANHGDPISETDLVNIFRRFYRADKARARDGGYGLGLSIAQSIVEEHGGKIWAESTGGINTFFVQLPLK